MPDMGADSDPNMFVFCVYDLSADQPYTTLKAPTSSCAQDIVTQVTDERKEVFH